MFFGRIKAYNLIQMFTNTMEKYFINRYLDMAHSRYRPGIPKDLYDTDVQTSIVAVHELRESIYSVTEVQKGVGEVEFTLDMGALVQRAANTRLLLQRNTTFLL